MGIGFPVIPSQMLLDLGKEAMRARGARRLRSHRGNLVRLAL